MKKNPAAFRTARRLGLLLPVSLSALLSACGGGTGSDSPTSRPQVQASLASGVTTLQLNDPTLPDAVANQLAQPTFHIAPVLLNAPDNTDADGNQASSGMGPRTQAVPATLRSLSTRRLTVRQLQAAEGAPAANGQDAAVDGTILPMASNNVVSTYTPAQIRAAYGLPVLPSPGAALTSAQAAQLGAGQTIYIVDAMHNPNVVAELATFNQKFGLPSCTLKTISVSTALPLAASGTGCELSVVFSSAGGTLSSTQPAYDSGWATEIALDVQWAHATAPLARIVLIEAASASVNDLLGAVKLANAMGPGIVSMSFGSQEGNWTASVEPAFSGANMTYLAATGDSGASVQWPAVSPHVVAVSGTSLTYSGTGTRSETTWSNTGGGVSAFTSAPAYQSNAVPGMGFATHRNVADVAFNADPNTGQYLAVIPSGSATVSWLSAGGTSLSTPQWAGIVAVANALRAANAKSALGAPHAVLYGQIAAVPGTYAGAFADITKGADGSCALCSARIGYDQVTGLGTPNAGSLLSALSGAALPAAPPTVTPAVISGQVGTALSFTVSATAPDPLTYALSGAPAGMAINSSGAVTWATPVAGSYAVTVIAKDSKTGLSGQAVYTVNIASVHAPVVNPASISGKAGTALSFNVSVTAANPVTYSLSGAPAGMSIGSTGTVTWAAPVAGNYAVTVTAKDSKTGLSGQGTYTINISSTTSTAIGPVVTAPAMNGTAGNPLSGTISISDPGVSSLSVSISGIPMGVTFSQNGFNLVVNWANPVTGSYTLKIQVSDSAGHSTQATMPITIR